MKLAILEAGTPPEPLIEQFGRYPAMFERLLGDGIDYDSFDVAGGRTAGRTGRTRRLSDHRRGGGGL